MLRGGGNKAGRYLEMVADVEGGKKWAIWLHEGCEGWGWSRVMGELQKMTHAGQEWNRVPNWQRSLETQEQSLLKKTQGLQILHHGLSSCSVTSFGLETQPSTLEPGS